jgi:hypothetical protein
MLEQPVPRKINADPEEGVVLLSVPLEVAISSPQIQKRRERKRLEREREEEEEEDS